MKVSKLGIIVSSVMDEIQPHQIVKGRYVQICDVVIILDKLGMLKLDSTEQSESNTIPHTPIECCCPLTTQKSLGWCSWCPIHGK